MFRTVFAILLCVLIGTSTVIEAQHHGWTWADAKGRIKTRQDLDNTLADHKQWVTSAGTSGALADLAGADLSGAFLPDAYLVDANLIGTCLSGANLRGADLWGANLSRADLSRADLNKADLSERGGLPGAFLPGAFLTGAFLIDANLSGADLRGADLSGANLSGANLRGANLTDAILQGAETELMRADLSGADLTDANLSGATFEPARLPPLEHIARAKNLSRMEWSGSPKQLSELRKLFKEQSLRTGDRQITAALRRQEAARWETALFDWTCEFGANAFRPLWLIACISLTCTPLYWISFHSGGPSGLYLLASGKRVNTGNERLRVLRLRYYPPSRSKFRWPRLIIRRIHRELHALATA